MVRQIPLHEEGRLWQSELVSLPGRRESPSRFTAPWNLTTSAPWAPRRRFCRLLLGTDSSLLRVAERAGLEKEEVIKQFFLLAGREEWRRRGIDQSSIYGSCVSYGFRNGSRIFGASLLTAVNVNNFLVGTVFVLCLRNEIAWCLSTSLSSGKPRGFIWLYWQGCQV